jgi:hypothetical protein
MEQERIEIPKIREIVADKLSFRKLFEKLN